MYQVYDLLSRWWSLHHEQLLAACKVEFQPFTRSYSQLPFFNFFLPGVSYLYVYRYLPLVPGTAVVRLETNTAARTYSCYVRGAVAGAGVSRSAAPRSGRSYVLVERSGSVGSVGSVRGSSFFFFF